VAQLKVLFLIILQKVTREMKEGYYKLGANVGCGRGQLEINVRHLLGVQRKSVDITSSCMFRSSRL